MTDERMPPPAASGVVPAVEPASDDVAHPPTDSALPGVHRGGFRRELTQPLPIAPPLAVHPEPDPAVAPEVQWIRRPPALPKSAGWSLLFGTLGLVLACFVGWGFPIGLIGVVLAILALRRPWEKRETAVWGLGLSLASLAYSAGWLWWAASQGALFS
ncbi:hypothetical protein E1I21_12365 [Microbacterium oleivorans]|uniref:hypothetical protein n=1 Tax=Microbacterium oleivorans TaxID=273677 RepID=UPI00097615C0|nr:hypothetical protein [Microbacterium oleivorans]AZS44813.1 hypothetical protein BWL13_02410 [Microbacterium oleivorans]THE06368.1 hypothetical protein E1I21_12365 [Microbacterium oleivorans]